MRRNPLGGLTIKAALTIGFGLTLGVWLLTGYRFTQTVADAERHATDIAARYVQAQEHLAALRAKILTASGTTRDALLDRTQQPIDVSRRLLNERLTGIDEALGQYILVMYTPEEQMRLAELRNEGSRFAATLRETLTPDAELRSDGRLRFRDEVLPGRAAFLEAVDRLQALNRAAFVEYQASLTDVHSAAEQTMRRQLGLALLCGLCIAILATVYASRLEKRLVSQLMQDALKTKALQDLSIKMIRAQEDERRRIARELHDEVGQALTAIKVELSLAGRALGGSGASLRSAQTITDGALHTVRDLSQLLHPSVLDDLGLPEAVDSYLREFSKRYGVRTRLHLDGMAVRLAPDIEVAAYRIIQEALTNVARHAHATDCAVTIHRHRDRCQIVVEDDGHGFETARFYGPGHRPGLGLIGMRERALQLAGMVSVESTPGHGTRVIIDLPARSGAEGPDEASVAGEPAAEPT